MEELDDNLNKFFESKEFTNALSGLKRKMESSDNGGFDVQPNNYTVEQLSRDITKREQSKEHKDLMNVLKRDVIKKYPHKIKL